MFLGMFPQRNDLDGHGFEICGGWSPNATQITQTVDGFYRMRGCNEVLVIKLSCVPK